MSGFAGGAVRRAHPALRGYVDRYVGYHLVLDSRAVHHGLPSTSATVILAFEEPLDTAWLADPVSRSSYWTLASGLHTAPALIRTHGLQHGIQLDLSPAGVRRLLGLPIGALAGTLTEHDALPTGLDDIHPRLAQARTWAERFDILEQRLLRTFSDRPAVRPELDRAWRLLCAGNHSVSDVAEHVGYSRRRLSTLVGAEYGVSPQELVRLARFARARALATGGVPLSDAALSAGYADQAHLSREWRRMAGQTPRESLRGDFPILQDR